MQIAEVFQIQRIWFLHSEKSLLKKPGCVAVESICARRFSMDSKKKVLPVCATPPDGGPKGGGKWKHNMCIGRMIRCLDPTIAFCTYGCILSWVCRLPRMPAIVAHEGFLVGILYKKNVHVILGPKAWHLNPKKSSDLGWDPGKFLVKDSRTLCKICISSSHFPMIYFKGDEGPVGFLYSDLGLVSGVFHKPYWHVTYVRQLDECCTQEVLRAVKKQHH